MTRKERGRRTVARAFTLVRTSLNGSTASRPYKDGLVLNNPEVFAPGARPSKLSKALYAGIIADDIEVTDGFDMLRPPCANEMTENP
eukprot:4315073-Heterocapsa_arctica.AAC.1